jgi:hypothetical protein
MTEEYEFINEMISDFEERNQFLKKYYPYFKIIGDGTKVFQKTSLEQLDIGFILLTTLRFLVEENNFKNRGVSYNEISDFLYYLVNKAYLIVLPELEKAALTEEVISMLTNSGQPYEFHYYDPTSQKKSISRITYMKGEIDPLLGSLKYYITDSGIEFYLETKEIKELNKISIQQVLLEKMVSSKNFKGARQVVQRITNQVAKLHLMKREVLNLINFNPVEGDKLYGEFFSKSMDWFDKEEDYFINNLKAVENAREKTSSADGLDTIRDINALNDELKKASEKYGDLLSEVVDLKKKVDEIRAARKIKVLKTTFDYRNVVDKMIGMDRSDDLALLMSPFLESKKKKFFDFKRIDSLLNFRVSCEEDTEVVVEEDIMEYIFDDVVENERIKNNHDKYIACLYSLLNKNNEITLNEYNDYLESVFTDKVFFNGDYFSFLIALSGKTRYVEEELNEDISDLEESMKAFREKTGHYIAFEIIFRPEESIVLRSGFQTTNFIIRRLYIND